MHSISSVAEAVPFVRTAGKHALEEQKKLESSDRQVKSDNSVVTRLDREVEEYLQQKLSNEYPAANIIGEESDSTSPHTSQYTFAIDPIDGTDSFSQGMPGWTVSVGLLNEHAEPVAGIVYAPAWDALFFADIDRPATYNGMPLSPPEPPESIGPRTNILVDSRIHLMLHLETYPGKLRSMGSTALHLCGFLTYEAVIGAISREARLWDLAGAHAINASLAQSVDYLGGGELTYENMMDGTSASDIIIAGTTIGKRLIRKTFTPRAERQI
jgi:myo-inositol-1(or 4)-monophosphatase